MHTYISRGPRILYQHILYTTSSKVIYLLAVDEIFYGESLSTANLSYVLNHLNSKRESSCRLEKLKRSWWIVGPWVAGCVGESMWVEQVKTYTKDPLILCCWLRHILDIEAALVSDVTL